LVGPRLRRATPAVLLHQLLDPVERLRIYDWLVLAVVDFLAIANLARVSHVGQQSVQGAAIELTTTAGSTRLGRKGFQRPAACIHLSQHF
jgi:hypothetical protein